MFFFRWKEYIIYGAKIKFPPHVRSCGYSTFPSSVFPCKLLVRKIKVYRRFPWLFMSAGERAQKVRRNCKRVDTQSDRRAFVWERKMIYCRWGGSYRVHGELWWRRGGAKLWSCWASISQILSPIQRVCSRVRQGKQNEFNYFPPFQSVLMYTA